MAKYEDILKEIQGKTYTDVSNRQISVPIKKKKNKNGFEVAEIPTGATVSTPLIPTANDISNSILGVDKYQNYTLDQYNEERKRLLGILEEESEKKEEKVKWWDSDKNVFSNVGNVLYKTFVEPQDNKYEHTQKYLDTQKELEELYESRDNYLIKNKEYSSGVLGAAEKIADTIGGNAMTATKGIEATTKKILGQEVGEDVYKQHYYEKLAEKARQESSGVGGLGLDILGSWTRMSLNAMAGTPTGALATGFANYGGSAYNEAKRNGATEKQATEYGLVIGSLEMGMEKLLGGFGNVYGKSTAGKLTSKVMEKVLKNKGVRDLIVNAAGEFTEEYLQEFLEPIVKNVILEEDNGADFWNTMQDQGFKEGLSQLSSQFFNEQNLRAGFTGFVSAGLMQLPNSINYNIANQSNKNAVINQMVEQAENQLGRKLNNDEKSVIAEEVNKAYAQQETIRNKNIKEISKENKSSEGLDLTQVENKTDYSLEKVQGLENYTRDEIKNISKDYIKNTLLDSGIEANIEDLEIIGSRNRGNAKNNSDLDVVVELKGDNLREDDLFNALNDTDNQLYIDGIKVDINPIVESESGNIKDYLERNKQYDKEVLNKETEKTYNEQKVKTENKTAYSANEKQKTNNLNEYISDAATREVKQNELNRQSVKESILDYIEDNNIKNPSVEEMMNAMDDYDMMDNSGYDLQDYREAEKLYRSVAQDIYNEKYSNNRYLTQQEETPTTEDTRATSELFNRADENIAPIKENISKISEQMHSLSNQIETLQEGLENASKSKGYVEEFKENIYDKQKHNALTEKEADLYQNALMNDEGYLKSLDEQANAVENNTKLINKVSNDIQDTLGLGKKQKETLRGIVNDAIENDYSVDEISNKLQEEFSRQTYTIPNEEAKNIKKLIKETPIKVSDGIKKDIADYGNFQKNNFNKIIFSRNGTPVDVAYQMLSEQAPSYFPSDIINPTDQLLKISEVANMMNEISETVDIPSDTFDNMADYIRNSIIDDKYNSQVRSDASLSNDIQFNFIDEVAPTTIRSQESIDEFKNQRDISPVRSDNKAKTELKEKFNATKAKAQEMFINRNQQIDNLAKATGNEDIKFAGDMLNNVASEAQYNINNAQTNANGIRIGKSVKEIFTPAREAGLYEAFNDYLIQKSNIERHAVGKGSEVPLIVSQQLVEQYEQENPQFKTWAKDVYKYFDNVLKEQVDAGLITEDKYNDYRGENGIYRSYVPFYSENIDRSRYFDENNELRAVTTLKKSKGNAKDTGAILAVEDAMAKQTYAYKNAIRTNELYKQIVSTQEKFDAMLTDDLRSNPSDLTDSLMIDEDGNAILTAYYNGEKVSSKISEELYNELSRTNENRIKQLEEDFSLLTKPIQKLSDIRRKLITSWNPIFLVRNAIKDIQDAAINSKHSKDMLKNYFNGKNASIIELAQAKTTEAQQFLALYGADNTYGDYAGKTKNKLSKLNELIELAPRFAEFKASLQNGESVQQAIYNAREVTTNFGRGGYVTKALNRNGFTFLNASVQGLDKMIRNITGQNGIKGYTQVVAKGVMLAVAPAILNHLMFGWGDDKDEDYEALPDYIKDNYYLIKLEDGTFIRIPKGRITAVIGSAARRTLETIETGENQYKGWGSNAWSQVGVGDLGNNNLLAPIKQVATNKAWHGGDIVPTRLQKLPSGEQSDEKTDAISKFIGETLGVSPKKINYLIDQYSGAAGDVLLPMLTPASNNGASNPIEYALAPVADAFVVNSTDDNKYAGEFYETKDKLEINKNSFKATDEDVLKYKYMSSISSQLSELYKERREIQSDTRLSKKEKYKKVQKVQEQINSLAKEALSNYKDINKTDTYANINDVEYYKDNDGEWNKANESDIEFTSGLNTSEKTSYYKTKNKISSANKLYKEQTNGLDDEKLKSKYASEKKENITKAIINSGLDDYTKAMIYSKSYASRETMTNAVNAGYDIDTYITALYDMEELRDKYSKNNGYSTEQRKMKLISYVNSLNMDIPLKAMLIRNYYTSFKQYNNDIVNYVSNLDISYEDKIEILKGTGMKVNRDRVSW